MTDLRKAAEMALGALEMLDRRGGLGLDVHEYLRTKIEALRQALAQPEQESVGACVTCGAPKSEWLVDAVNMSQERVDETAKREHEWKGLDGEIPGLGLVTEEFYNGMLFAEDVLREKNT